MLNCCREAEALTEAPDNYRALFVNVRPRMKAGIVLGIPDGGSGSRSASGPLPYGIAPDSYGSGPVLYESGLNSYKINPESGESKVLPGIGNPRRYRRIINFHKDNRRFYAGKTNHNGGYYGITTN